MATLKPNAIAATVAQIETIKPRNTRTVKVQPPAIVTWERLESTLIETCKMAKAVENKWVLVADMAWTLGVRPADFEPVKGAKGDAKYSDTWLRIAGMVVKSFSQNIQSLLTSPTSALDADDRALRRVWLGTRDARMKDVLTHLKKHEDLERTGPKEKVTFAQSIVAILEEQKDRIKKKKVNKPDDIDFNDTRVLELLSEAIAELT